MSDYKNKIRVRTCGILIEDDSLLLVQLRSPVTDELIWMPPGGRVEFGESYKEAVKREFLEETGLEVNVGELIYLNELIRNGFHALELYFKVFRLNGKLRKGSDPELPEKNQIIHQVRFHQQNELPEIKLEPEYFKHHFQEKGKP